MENSLLFYCLMIYFIISVSGRSIDSINNETQYQCMVDDSCSQYDNIRLYNQKVYCCRPGHTLIFKVTIDNTLVESFALQTGDVEKINENEAQAGKTEAPQRGRTEAPQKARTEAPQRVRTEAPHQVTTATPQPDKINEADAVTYSVLEVRNERDDENDKSLSSFIDEHFPTTLYFDLKREAQGRLVKRHLNMRPDNFKVIKAMPHEKTARVSERVSNVRQTLAPRSKTVTTCVCDKIESRGFMDFLFNFFQSLCQDSWI